VQDAGANAADEAALGPASWHWLAPSLAVFVLGLFVMGSQPTALPHFAPAWPGGLAAEVALAQPEVAAWFDNSHRHERNRWLAATFDWTNGSHSLTTHPLIFNTNGARP
jgi:hypothetical protein